MNQQETLYAIALTRLAGISQNTAHHLYMELGSASAVYEHRRDMGSVLPNCSTRLEEAIRNWDDALWRAEAEMRFVEHYSIDVLDMNSQDYPARLRECADAPIVLYYKGTSNLNQSHIISIVGTRRCSAYGQDLTRSFITQLKEICPQVLVVSGLAYGIDICAHRQALQCGYDTVGVLAHGLDKIYPQSHRDTATLMARQGGLLTEYMSETNMDKGNFVRRNRIVAGISDATIVIESAIKGGSLITARIAQDYNRSVFAFPGAVGAKASEGCNSLIRDNAAALITSASDFAAFMGWETVQKQARCKVIETSIFPNLTPDEQRVAEFLQLHGDENQAVIAVGTNIPMNRLTAILFQLEMNGVVRPMAGGHFHLIMQ
jgi:DNA processing protein